MPPPPARPSKAGYALLMRTSDGEEAVNPFRSLDVASARADRVGAGDGKRAGG